MRSRLRTPVVLAVLAIGMAWGPIARGQLSQPFPLDLAGASIEEGARYPGAAIPDRDIRVVFRLRDSALCNAARDGLSYALLVDADRLPGSGRVLSEFPRLGIDLQIAARCDGASGRFVSSFGDVTAVAASPGTEPRLMVTTRLSRLPSNEFYFLATVSHGDRYIVAPESGQPVYFGILERRLW